jgi:hypothetical protein
LRIPGNLNEFLHRLFKIVWCGGDGRYFAAKHNFPKNDRKKKKEKQKEKNGCEIFSRVSPFLQLRSGLTEL